MTFVRKSFSKANQQKVNAALLLVAAAKARGEQITRVQMFEAMVDMGHFEETRPQRQRFGSLVRDAIAFGHKELEYMSEEGIEKRPFTAEEDEIILKYPRAEASKMIGRPAKNIGVRKWFLQNRDRIRRPKGSPRVVSAKYSDVELALLREKFPIMDTEKMQAEFFPTRTVNALTAQARRMSLRKQSTIVPSIDGHKHVIIDIIQIANARGITAVQLDILCNTSGYFKWNFRDPRRRINLMAIERACRLLGLEFGVKPSTAERPPLRQMIREFKTFQCPMIDEVKPKAGKGVPSKRPEPARPINAGNHRPANRIMELAQSIVPRSHPARDDAIQEICVELIAGGLTEADFNTKQGMRNIRDIVNASYRQNFEQSGFARSFDAPLGDGTSTLHDLIAAE